MVNEFMKKSLTVIICIMIGVGIFSQMVIAGDEDNPEIEDPEDDVAFFIDILPRSLINRFCKHLDVLKAWFFENPDEPDYLFATIKLKEYKIATLMVSYGVGWYYDNIDYIAVFTFSRGDEYISGLKIQESVYVPIDDFYIINEGENTITFKIPKDIAGELEPGDIINDPFIFGTCRFVSDNLADLIDRITGYNVLFVDFAMSSNDYTIKY